MQRRSPSPYRLLKRVVESCAFWIAAFNGLQAAYFAYGAASALLALVTRHARTFAWGTLQSAEDAVLRTVVWLWILRWAEAEEPLASTIEA